jgi:flagellar motility protein MotE (MotC chaperone)
MMTKLQNPMVAAAAGLMISVALGVMLVWRAATPLLTAAAQAVPAKKVEEVATERGWDFWTIEIENLSTELKDERARLRQQSEQLEQRAARVEAEARELGRMRTEIEALRGQMSDRLIEMKEDEVKNLKTLAQTYTNLTPRASVAIIRELDDVTAVKILSLMKPDVVAPIFEEMSRAAGGDTTLTRRAAVLSNQLRLMKAAGKAGAP